MYSHALMSPVAIPKSVGSSGLMMVAGRFIRNPTTPVGEVIVMVRSPSRGCTMLTVIPTCLLPVII